MDTVQLDPDEGRPPGAPGPPPRIHPLILVGAALLALLAGYIVLGRGDPGAPVTDPPVPLPVPSAAGPNQRQYLGVTRICAPVTDGRRRLAASFEVTNVSDTRAAIGTVTGVLPEGGLRRHGPATAGGDCGHPGTEASTGTIEAGKTRFYTVHFDLPRTCPARYPVQVKIGFAAAGFDETSLSLLYSDLSVPDFDTCGPGEAKAGTSGWFLP